MIGNYQVDPLVRSGPKRNGVAPPSLRHGRSREGPNKFILESTSSDGSGSWPIQIQAFQLCASALRLLAKDIQLQACRHLDTQLTVCVTNNSITEEGDYREVSRLIKLCIQSGLVCSHVLCHETCWLWIKDDLHMTWEQIQYSESSVENMSSKQILQPISMCSSICVSYMGSSNLWTLEIDHTYPTEAAPGSE